VHNVICNSAKLGLIPQIDYFDKEIANNENTSGYYIISKGDFVYNPRKSKEAPYGPISVYLYNSQGIVSPLYLCFSPKSNINTEFYLWYFKSSVWHRYVYLSGDSGVRHDRVSMKDSVFFSLPLNIPSSDEQQKISSFLTLLDKRISKQRELVENLKSYKRGLIFSIFKPNNAYDILMSHISLSNLLVEYKDRKTANLRVCSVAVNKGVVDQIEHLGRSFAAKDTSKYAKVRYGDVVYTKSPTGDFPYGIVKQSKNLENVAVSPLYGVYEPKTFFVGNMLHEYFSQHENANNYIKPLAQKGAKNTINITNSKFLDGRIYFPLSDKLQELMSNFFDELNLKISSEEKILNFLNKEKHSLLSAMFI
jgi:type I restriction enzyme S subunit